VLPGFDQPGIFYGQQNHPRRKKNTRPQLIVAFQPTPQPVAAHESSKAFEQLKKRRQDWNLVGDHPAGINLTCFPGMLTLPA
jgi:hypothetical protein